MKYYIVGIKGSGLSALANILYDLGHTIRGADITKQMFTQQKLEEKNIIIDSLDNMRYEDFDIIVIGNAFLNKYDFKNKKTMTYQELLSELNDKYYSIAICGTHGKTTTTNMIKHVLEQYYDINYLVGDGSGRGNKNAKYFVYEACEHRDHFLSYHPNVIVCTNIDYDHVEYFENIKQYHDSFEKFFLNCKDYLIINNNINYNDKKVITYGYNNSNILATNIFFKENGTYFDLKINNEKYNNLFLPFYGKHILEDALACISCCLKLNISLENIISSLSTYKNAKRRYNIIKIKDNVIIDDYGHHPNEIKATLEAIKQEFNSKKILIFYHPDRPKRLLTFLEEYKKVFFTSDKTYVLPFLNNNEEEKFALSQIIDNKNIFNYNDDFLNHSYSNYVFLFTGSKEMKNVIEKLKNHLNRI